MKDCKEKEGEWSQILAILIVSLASFTSGIFFTWPNPSMPILVEQGASLEIVSYVTVIPSVSLAIFSPIFGALLDRIGRKRAILFAAIPQLISWTMIATYKSIYVIFAARFISGIADASLFIAVPSYIAEVATPKIRGTWGNALTFLAYVGNFMATLVGNFSTIETAAVIWSIVPIILFVGTIFLPETPYYLLIKKEKEAAMESLRWFRRKRDVDDEFKQLNKDIERQMSETGRIRDLFLIPSNRNSLITAAFLRGAQQFSGNSAISMYAPYIFKNIGEIPAIASILFYQGLLVVCNFGASVVLDKIGRRRAMIISSVGCCILLSLESVFFYLNFETNLDVANLSFLPIIGLSLYVLFFSIGLGIMASLMLGELFSSSVKGKCLCVSNILQGIFVATCTKVFQLLMSSFGIHVAFGFFAVCCIISSFASFYFVPNTQGKTLEEIQQSFKIAKK